MTKKPETVLFELQLKINEGLSKGTSQSKMQELINFLAGEVKKRTRLGYGVDSPGANRKGLKALSPNYIKKRRLDKKRGRLHPDTTPSKSNLTRTGQMLNSLQGKAQSGRKGIINLKASRNDGKTNPEIAGYNEEKGRKFMNLSNLELKRARQLVRENLIVEVKKSISELIN